MSYFADPYGFMFQNNPIPPSIYPNEQMNPTEFNQAAWEAMTKPLQPLPEYMPNLPYPTEDQKIFESEQSRLRAEQAKRDQLIYEAFLRIQRQNAELQQEPTEITDDDDLIDPPDFQPMNLGEEPT